MQKKQAKKYIGKVLEAAFDPKAFGDLVRELVHKFEEKDDTYSGVLIPEAYRAHVSHYRRIGKYTDPTGEAMDILMVQVTEVAKLERTRTALRNFVVNRLKKFGDKQYALVAFYSKEDNGTDWRLSFVKIDYEESRSKRGNISTREILSPARRYSFLVGENESAHTAQTQLLPLLVNDYARPLVAQEKTDDHSIESTFSVEKVTDEFFHEYKNLFDRTIKILKDDLEKIGYDEQARTKFVKKLLGQIVFLYFIQKKGWLGAAKDQKMGEGNKRYLQNQFAALNENKQNYYADFLCHLFYKGLAKEHNDQNTKYYFEELDCKVPFLNGGLFEADHERKNQVTELPNDLFRNMESLKGGDRGTGILDVFDRYNFTIKEDEPLEKEVAIDPEMLGKVFENMLEINERKGKGAYYTPREIVHYMCRQSLIYYLDQHINSYAASHQALDSEQLNIFGSTTNKKGNYKLELQHDDIKIPLADLEAFIRNGHLAAENDSTVTAKGKATETYSYQVPETIYDHAAELDQALADIKICDPAIGSGAFPVGMLNEIVTARRALAHKLPQAQSPYHLKRHAIQNSIYGVDLDASAIDIARLRLWLSMIVDEEDYDNIEPLPNLDYKIVRGNSLVGLPEDTVRDVKVERELEVLKQQFFKETNHNKKQKLRDQINPKIRQLLDSAESFLNYKINFDFKLHFSEVWTQNGGFDLVIGNPPYVQIQKLGRDNQKPLKEQNFQTYAGRGDVYCLFYEKGNRLLRKRGSLCFITSNKWMRAEYGEKTRAYFAEKTNPIQVIDFGKLQNFESATVDTNILIFSRQNNQRQTLATKFKTDFDPKKNSIEEYIQQNSIHFKPFSKQEWVILSKDDFRIKKHIEQQGNPIKNLVKINYGIKTGYNSAFIIPAKIKDRLIKAAPRNAEIIKPLLRGEDIKEWKANFADLWLVATLPVLKLDIDEYPEIKEHLLSFGKTRLDQSGGKGSRKKTSNKWFETQDAIAYYEDFKKPKIIWGNLNQHPKFAYDEKGSYINAPSNLLTISDENISIKYVLAVLNSHVTDFYIRCIGYSRAHEYYEYKKVFVKKIILPEISLAAQKPFEILVDYVLWLKSHESLLETAVDKIMASYFESMINGGVYELYFEESLKAAKKDVLQYIREIPALPCHLAPDEKLAHIRRIYAEYHKPDHPLGQRLYYIDSVPEIRIIHKSTINSI